MGSVSIKFNCWEYSQRRAKVAKSSESLVRILPAEEIISRGSGEPEPFIWPNRASWFAERSMRLKQLARQSGRDRKSTRLNSSHVAISYAVFCLKKKNT